jgi:hypothetical protein
MTDQPKRKFTTGVARDVTDSANLLAEMPEQMRSWMNLRQGAFQHRVEKNGAVVIHPDLPDDTDIPPDTN